LITYGVLVFGLFCLFYPVLAGQPVELEFAEKYLKWFKTWILVAGK
jgi:dolichyl-phosphate-mannose--protein O-mannosyl transferase